MPSPTHRWWLLLWGVLQACPSQGSVLLAQQLPQQLTSPRYPEPYLKGQETTTVIEAPEGFAVKLIFQDFDLEPSQDCERDSVTVSWGGGPGGTPGRESPGLEPRGSGRWPSPESQRMDEKPKSGEQASLPGRRGSVPGPPPMALSLPMLPYWPQRDTQILPNPSIKSKGSHISH